MEKQKEKNVRENCARTKKGMRRMRLFAGLFACLLGVGLLAGCAGKIEQDQENAEGKGEHQKGEGTVIEDIDFSFLAEEEGTWKDNSLDDWQAVINQKVEPVLLEGEDEYSFGNRIGEGGFLFFSNHIVYSNNGTEYQYQWSGINGIRATGEEFSLRLDLEATPESDLKSHQESDLGSGLTLDLEEANGYAFGVISGEKGYVAVKSLLRDGKVCGHRFYGLDEELHEQWRKKLEDESFSIVSVMGDEKGNIHLLLREDALLRYVIYSPEWERIFDQREKLDAGFYSMENGGVIVRRMGLQEHTIDYIFYQADLETGELRKLTTFNSAKFQTKAEMFPLDVTMRNAEEVVWCGSEGVYFTNERTGEESLVYKWGNHGISPNQVLTMAVLKEGWIGILYNDVEGMNYLLLKPTEERTETKTFTIAVSPKNKGVFSGAVAYFSKRHPEYKILLKADYDETSLLTQLGAGDGPIIVDTALTGFEELESLWQPLDGFLEKSGVAEELIPEVVEFGKIGDRAYGIVTNYYIRTLLVKDQSVADWDYEGFLNYLERQEGDGIFSDSYVGGAPDFQKILFDCFNNGLSDNYYWNPEDGELIFGTEKFDRILRLSKKAKNGHHATMGVPLREGKVACEIVELWNVNGVNQLRERIEETGEKVIGFPTKDGARHMLVAGDPVAVRSTCTEEEKRVAYTFLRDMLTKEALSSPNAPVNDGSINRDTFKIRKDVLEDKYEEFDRRQVNSRVQELTNGKIPELWADYLKIQQEAEEIQKSEGQKDREFFWKLIQNGTVKKDFPAALEKVFEEELTEYERGVIDDRMVSEHLQNRFRLYLEEAK